MLLGKGSKQVVAISWLCKGLDFWRLRKHLTTMMRIFGAGQVSGRQEREVYFANTYPNFKMGAIHWIKELNNVCWICNTLEGCWNHCFYPIDTPGFLPFAMAFAAS